MAPFQFGELTEEVMVRRFINVFLIFISVTGCYVMTADFLMELKIEGAVSSEQGEPIQNAEIRFFDTGIDQWRQSSGLSLLVGSTNEQGQLSSTFSYLFGYEIRGKSSPYLPGTFDLAIEADGFSDARLSYQISSLPEEDGVLLLSFEVQLQKLPIE